jgi:uncharacterized protein (TIGR00730 family)
MLTVCYTVGMYPAEHPDDVAKRSLIQKQLQEEVSDRLSRIEEEFADGFDFINKYNDTVSFFGSARFPETNPHYQKARELAKVLSADGYTIVTGGGGGIMEAGDRGASEAGRHSIGLNIKLPNEQTLNPYATESMSFRYFFTRKVMLAYGAMAYVCFPGGFGTFDETFEIITLIQTKKMPVAPVILVGSEYWTALDMFIKTYMVQEEHAATLEECELYTITDDIPVIKAIIDQHRDATSSLVIGNGEAPVAL